MSGRVKNTEPNVSVYLVTCKRQWAQTEKQEIHIHAKNHPYFFPLSGQGLQQLGRRVCGLPILGGCQNSSRDASLSNLVWVTLLEQGGGVR